jgi:hypothetical protein
LRGGAGAEQQGGEWQQTATHDVPPDLSPE